jgi:hypothetical protein
VLLLRTSENVLYILRTEQVNIYSFGGNARAMATGRAYPQGSNAFTFIYSRNINIFPGFSQFAPSLYRIENSCPVRVTNCVDQVRHFSLNGASPFLISDIFAQFQFEPDNDWNFIYEDWQGNTTLSKHCERPVLYARTNC